MTTFHTGDCSTGCDICARLCAGNDHEDCTGTLEERAHGDLLVSQEGPDAFTTEHPVRYSEFD